MAQCRRVCEGSKSCGSATTGSTTDCFTLCDDIDAVNNVSNCYATFDALYDCIEKHGVCGESETACASQRASYDDCIAENCSKDPDRDDCAL